MSGLTSKTNLAQKAGFFDSLMRISHEVTSIMVNAT
ncbi:MAG: hypothetical protein ACI9DO_003190 [Reinekea sp.]